MKVPVPVSAPVPEALTRRHLPCPWPLEFNKQLLDEYRLCAQRLDHANQMLEAIEQSSKPL